MANKGSWAPIVFLALIGSITLIPIIFPEISTPVALWIQENVHRFGAWGPIALVGLMVLATIFSPIPNSLITLAIGATYGPLWGSVIAIVGAFLAAMLAFYLSKKFGSSFVEKYIPHTHMIHDFFKENAFFTIFILRIIPSISFDMVSYGAGLTSMSYRTFALATLLGILPGTISIVLVGAGLTFDSGLTSMSYRTFALATLLGILPGTISIVLVGAGLTFDSGLSWIGIGLYALLIVGGVILAQRMNVFDGENKSEPVKEKRKGIQKKKK